jgi:hypothetical protein
MMITLHNTHLSRIERQLQLIARPLDWAIWRAWRDDGTWLDVIPHLAAYQNADGGFGHGIEPDVWHPASSPLATSVALQYAHTAGIPIHHPLVQRACAYLATSYDVDSHKWHPMAPGVNNYPHAPWWHADASTGHNALDDDWPNPTAEIIGYLNAYHGADVDMPTLHDTLIHHITQADTMESHALACYVRAYDWVPPQVQVVLYPHVVRLLRQTIHPIPAEWQRTYVPTPLDYVHTPASSFFTEIEALITIQLDQWCMYVQQHALWMPTWQWGQYADEWATAQRWWAGKMTVERMMILRRFGRIP